MTFDAAAVAREAAEHGDSQLNTVIGQLAGYASTCWLDAGEFDSSRAAAAVESTIGWLRGELDRANLGLATTGEMLDEIRCRIKVDYFAGGGGLDYTTVNGRPGGNLAGGGHHVIDTSPEQYAVHFDPGPTVGPFASREAAQTWLDRTAGDRTEPASWTVEPLQVP